MFTACFDNNFFVRDNQMKQSKKVILWGENSLLLVGIETFLREKKGWEVIRINKQQGNEQFINFVTEEQPTTVILFGADSQTSRALPALLLAEQPKLRIITVTLDNNIAEVYGRQEVQVKEAVDLLSLIDCP